MKLYKSYNFVDKDPIIDEVRTVMQDSGITYAEIEARSGVKGETLRRWFEGKTKRPLASTVRAVLRAMGADLTVTKTAPAVVVEARTPRRQDWRNYSQKPHVKGVRK
jgi:transcriptional regulator with XRE-family HTH domain